MTSRIRTERIARGIYLYHGTTAEVRFEEEQDTPDGPAWFSNSVDVARRFARRHGGDAADARVIVYQVTIAIPRVACLEGREDFDRLLRRLGFDLEEESADMEEISEAMAGQSEFNGWNLHNNYQHPTGDDILIVSPEQYLRRVRVEPA